MTAPGLVRGVAEGFERTVGAAWLAGDADLTPVVDELMSELDPVVAGDNLHQLLFDLFGIVGLGKAEAVGEAQDVRVDDDAFCDFVGDAKNDIRGFAGGSGNGEELGHGIRHLAAEVSQQFLCGSRDGLGLVAIEAGGLDLGFERRERGLRHSLWCRELTE